jgi:hypothetical protein
MSKVIIGDSGHNNFQTYQAPPDMALYVESISFIIRALVDAGTRYAGIGLGEETPGVTTAVLSGPTGDVPSVIQANFGVGYVQSVVGTGTGWLVTAPLPQLDLDANGIVWVGSFRQGGGSFPADQIGAVYLQATLTPLDTAQPPVSRQTVTLMPGYSGS